MSAKSHVDSPGGGGVEATLLLTLEAVVAGGGAYLGAYLRQKGQNLARKEDLDYLVTEVQRVTKTTEDIKNEISHEYWNRQRQWEMKRDVLFKTVKGLSELEEALVSYNTAVKVKAESKNPDVTIESAVRERSEKWLDVATRFNELRVLVEIVCGKELIVLLIGVVVLTNKIVVDGITKGDSTLYDKSMPELQRRLVDVGAAIRRELGINPIAARPTPQSSKSSAVQAPGSPSLG